jgi:hypothetical protein
VTHSLDFPVDADAGAPPALDVLLSACEPVRMYGAHGGGGGPPALMYPPRLAWSTTLELANRPVLAALGAALLPALPAGQHLTAVRERLDVLMPLAGAPPAPNPADGRAATLLVTLPVRFRGGALVVHADGARERLHHSKKAGAHVEWAAWIDGAAPEIEPVRKGFRLDVRYAVYVRPVDPPAPPEDFRALLGSVLSLSRGRRIGFYLAREYGVNPAEAVAESLVPMVGASACDRALR